MIGHAQHHVGATLHAEIEAGRPYLVQKRLEAFKKEAIHFNLKETT